jgi:hypothetical protein
MLIHLLLIQKDRLILVNQLLALLDRKREMDATTCVANGRIPARC